MKSINSYMYKHNCNVSNRTTRKQVFIKASSFGNEYQDYYHDRYTNEFKLNLDNLFNSRKIKPRVLMIPIKQHWPNVCKVSLSVNATDNQYCLDIITKEDRLCEDVVLDDSIDEVLIQLNKWQVGQYIINIIDMYINLMEFDKNRSVSIPLSIHTTRMIEFDT